MYDLRFNFIPIISCLCGALFFFFTLSELTIFNSLTQYIIAELNINSIEASALASVYFFSNAIWLIPGGILLDIFPTRKLTLIFLSLCVISSLALYFSGSLLVYITARFIQGAGSAMSLLIVLRLGSQFFPRHAASIIGFMISIGLLGGVFSENFFVWIVNTQYWRLAVLLNGLLGLLILILSLFCLREPPRSKQVRKKIRYSRYAKLVCYQLRKVLNKSQNLKCGLYIGLMNLPVFVLATLWGNLYLKKVKSLGSVEAGFIISLIFVGELVGSPILGWLSDRISSRLIPMKVSAVIAFLCASMIIFFIHTPWLIAVIFFLIGFFISAQVMVYPLIIESNEPKIASTASGFGSLISNLVGALAQGCFGIVISLGLGDSSLNYQLAFGLLLVAFIISFGLCFFIEESSKCR